MNTRDYSDAPSGIGPQADEWKNKPHRLIYDLCAEVERLKEVIADMERLVIDQVVSHWMAQGGESQFGPLAGSPTNADEVVSEILERVRARVT